MILDTNALSAVLNGDPAIASIAARPDPIWIPSIVIGEYRFGLLGSKRRYPLETFFRELLAECFVLSVDEATAGVYALVRFELKHKGHALPQNDVWIAALARQYHLPLVTRDAHFELVDGIQRVSW